MNMQHSNRRTSSDLGSKNNQQHILPIKDSRILTSLEGALIVLWLLADRGPMTFGKLLEVLFTQSPDESSLRATALISLFNAMRGLVDAVRYLNECGLLELDQAIFAEAERKALKGEFRDLTNPDGNLVLKVSAGLDIIKNLFSLDLAEYAAGKVDEIRIEPVFGKPETTDTFDVFVVMPFVDELTPIYTSIRTITQNLGLRSKRGDDVFTNDEIVNESWTAIFNSRLCIAECTGRDPNVFYEMGIAHTLGRPCILISQSVNDIPFDVRHRRVITYDNTREGMVRFRDILTRTIQDELGIERNKLREILDKLE